MEELGLELEDRPSDLGRAKKVAIDKDNTTIVGAPGKPAGHQGRIEQIRHQVETTTDYDREKLEERRQARRRRRPDQRREPPPRSR